MDSELKLRYARQIAVPEVGQEGQQKLLESKVLVIGCGALGSMVAMQLAAAGVGTLGIADFDKVDISNLQRQFFFKTEDSGDLKVELVYRSISAINPKANVKIHREMITSLKAVKLFPNYDFIVDATDNPDSKRMTGEVSRKSHKPCCIAGVRDFRGQVMTFLPSDPRFEDYFGQAVSEGLLPCSLGGVMGPSAAIAASLQASEAIKYLVGIGNLLSGRLLIFNLLSNSFRLLSL